MCTRPTCFVRVVGKKIAFSILCGVILMNTSHINFQDKYRIAYRGEWLYSFGSTTSALEVDSAVCRPRAVAHFVPQRRVKVSWG